jgi:hypothetical protein
MQAILAQQRSNVIQFPGNKTAGGGDGTGTLIPVVRELISSINKLTGVMVGQAKGSKGLTPTSGTPTDSLNSSLESEVETGRYQETQLNLLKKIEENTRGGGATAEKVKDESGGDFSLGGIASIIAVAAGTIAGLVTAWVKTVKFFVTGVGVGIEKMVVFLSRWFPSLKTILFNIEVTVMLLVENMKGIFKNVVGKIGTIFTGAIDFFKGIFGEGSMIGKVITTIKTAVTGFLEPIIAGFRTISEVSGPIGKAVSFVKGALGSMMEFFGMIGSKLGSFGTLFSAVSKIVSKIAYPLMIIMSIWDTVKGALAGWEEGGLVGAIGGAIKGLFNGLVFGVLDMIKGAISWIAGALGFDAVEEFLDSFSFADMFSDLVDAVLFIPQQIQNFIMAPIETIKKLGAFISDAFNKVVEFATAALAPIKAAAAWIVDAFAPIGEIMDTLIDAYLFIPRQLFGLINDYIITPLTNVFAPLTDFFKGLAEKIMGIFEDFGIPEMGFSVLGKKFSIGPWYPFRPDEGTVRVGSNTSLDQKSSSSGTETSNYKQNIVSSGTGGIDEKTMRANGMSEEAIARAKARNKDETRVLTQTEKVVNGNAVMKENFATFDPKTGKAMLSGDAAATGVTTDAQGNKDTGGTREISKRAFSQIKANAQAGGDNEKVAEIVKEDDAYQKLSWFDKRKVDVGYAKASDLLTVSQPATADTVSKKSSDSASLKENLNKAAGNTNVVNSPLTTYNNQKVTNVKAPIRNQESSVGEWLKSKYQ